MFFENKIRSISPGDRVLEVGPGATPHPRSDVFLEKKFDTKQELIAQSGHVGLLQTNKPVIYYDGDTFPFADHEFDYVICSHVLEHVSDVDAFLKEVQRVGKKGYLEFPTIYYDYIYNFPEHSQFLFYREHRIYWMPKNETGINTFLPVQALFLKSCKQEYYRLIDDFQSYFFQGFEWDGTITSVKTNNLNDLVYREDEMDLSGLNKPLTNDDGIRQKIRNKLLKIVNRL